MSKFKIGDKIVGKEGNPGEYTFTRKDKNFVGKVTELFGSFLKAEILECDDKTQIGKKYDLDEKYFDLLPPFKVGDRVKLVRSFFIVPYNPVWGGLYGTIGGTVRGIPFMNKTYLIRVEWDNGNLAVYKDSKDLQILTREEDKRARKLEIGDKVRVVKGNEKCEWFKYRCCRAYIGKTGEIKEIKGDEKIRVGDFIRTASGATECGSFARDCLELVERGDEKMSKYDELREKIDNLTAWDKEADDVAGEIQGYLKSPCEISIALGSSGYVSVRGMKVETFAFYSQCEKLKAFKAACLWILDQSGLKQEDEKAEKIAEIEKKIEDLQGEVEKLRGVRR